MTRSGALDLHAVYSATSRTRTSQRETAAGTWTKMKGMKVEAFIPFTSGTEAF